MTNEELVALIQGGDRDKLEQLWGQVERFVAAQANKRLVLSGGLGGVEFGDLYNAGYIAVVAAADTYDPAAGRAFIGWLALALKTAFSQAAGIRSRRQARDPIHQAHSLDAPVGEDTDGNTLADLQADPAAAHALQDAEERIWRGQLREALETALAQLPAVQGETLRSRFFQAQTLEQIADHQGVSKEAVRQWQLQALYTLRQRRELQQFVEDRTPYYLHVGVRQFHSTGESAVERIVIRRDRLAGPRASRPRLDRASLEQQAAGVGRDYIDAIQDPAVRVFFRLRFLRGLSWQQVAHVAGAGKSWTQVRDAVLRYLAAHPVHPDP